MASMDAEWVLKPVTHAKVWNDRGEPVLVRTDTIESVHVATREGCAPIVEVWVATPSHGGGMSRSVYFGGASLDEWEELLCAPKRKKETA